MAGTTDAWIGRIQTENGQNVVNASNSSQQKDGSRHWHVESAVSACISGRWPGPARICYDELFYLFAAGDANSFRLLRTDDISRGRISEGIRLQAICNSLVPALSSGERSICEPSELRGFRNPQTLPLAVLEYLDRNGDKRLSSEEYLATGENDQVSRRDFLLFDTDSDGYLTIEEFTPSAQRRR